MSDFLASVTSALGGPEIIALILGGITFGAFVMWTFVGLRTNAVSLSYLAFIVSALGVVFFVSRGAALYFAGSPLAPRNIGFGILWVVYIVSMTVGVSIRRRLT